ncbi:hypothetical protein EV426DRAFT_718669 [Tirmania nivea]|nr:hypothetical protein EV426DRAFT_718669 [Tirmania nivea]
MKFLFTLTSFLLATVTGVVASPRPSGSSSVLEAPIHYECCPYPKFNISVINFEYTAGQQLADHRGLKWYGMSGFKRYYGYVPDGWAPIPSNYTTAHLTWSGEGQQKVAFGSGSRSNLRAVHSLWFYLGFAGTPPGFSVPITITGNGPASYTTTIYTDPYDDGQWEHICLNWQDVSQIVIELPDCWDSAKGCKSAVFELDDIWVDAGSERPVEVKEPVLEYDSRPCTNNTSEKGSCL